MESSQASCTDTQWHALAVPPTHNQQVHWEIHEAFYATSETRNSTVRLRTPMQTTPPMNDNLNSGLTFRSSGCMCGATILSFSYQSAMHSTTRLGRQRPCVCSASSSVTTSGFGSRLWRQIWLLHCTQFQFTLYFYLLPFLLLQTKHTYIHTEIPTKHTCPHTCVHWVLKWWAKAHATHSEHTPHQTIQLSCLWILGIWRQLLQKTLNTSVVDYQGLCVSLSAYMVWKGSISKHK